MDKDLKLFWDQMNEKEYGFDGKIWIKNQDGHNQNLGYPTNQMLVGHKIEYLLLNGMISIWEFGNWLHKQLKDARFQSKLDGDNHIEVIDNILTKKIKEIK